MNPAVFERSAAIRYHEVDLRGFARPAVILALMQDVAAEHAMELGVSVRDLLRQGLTWVLSRITLEMDRYPRSAEEITIRTWPVLREGRFTVRDFLMTDGDGERLGVATTSWAALEIASRRPVILDERLPGYPLLGERALQDDFASLPQPGSVEHAVETMALRADMDINRHVNNTVYATWGLEAVPGYIVETMLPVKLEIAFRAETFGGDRILSSCAPAGHQDGKTILLHRIENAGNNKELARMRTGWAARP